MKTGRSINGSTITTVGGEAGNYGTASKSLKKVLLMLAREKNARIAPIRAVSAIEQRRFTFSPPSPSPLITRSL